MHLNLDLRAGADGHDLIRGQHIGFGNLVLHLGHAIIPAAQALNEDFAVLIRGEHLLIAIRPGHPEGESLDLLVRRSLEDLECAGLRDIDEVLAGLVLHDYGFAVFRDGEIIGVFVQIEALRRFHLAYKVISIGQITHLIDAHADLRHLAELFIILIPLLIAFAVLVDFKLSAGQLVFGIVLVHLRQLNSAANQGVYDLQLDNRADFGNACLIALDRKDIAGRRGNLMHDPSTIGDFGKRKAAVLGRGGSHNGSSLGKLCHVRLKQADQRTGQCVARIVLFHTVDLTVDDLVSDGIAIVGMDLHHGDLAASIVKGNGIFLVREQIVLVGRQLFQIILAVHREVGPDGGAAVGVDRNDLYEPIDGDRAAIGGSQFLRSIQAKGDGRHLTMQPDAKFLIGQQCFAQRDLGLLALIVKAGGGLGDLHLLPGIDQLHSADFRIQYHTVRCGDLYDLIFAQVQELTHSLAFLAGGNGIYHVSGRVTESTVQRDHILGSADLIDCAGKPPHFIDRLIKTLGGNSGKDLTGFADLDDAFLRHVGLCDLHDRDGIILAGFVSGHIK